MKLIKIVLGGLFAVTILAAIIPVLIITTCLPRPRDQQFGKWVLDTVDKIDNWIGTLA